MKKNEFLSVFHALQSGKNRTSLAVVVGVLAMLLLLLSELLPSGNTQKAAVSTAQTATVSQYQAQLEQQLEELLRGKDVQRSVVSIIADLEQERE